MALEGITLNAGSGGQKLATDLVDGFDFQIVKIGIGADDATPTSVSAANPMPVNVLSLIPGTGATNLGKAADAIAGVADTGVPPLVIRDDILTVLTPADGDYVPLRASNVGSLWVDIYPSSNTFAKKVDDPAGGADKGVAVLAVRDDSLSALVPIEGDYSFLRVNSTGALHVTGGGGGTEYNEDDVTPSPIVGAATLIERDDVLTIVTPVEGDWIGLRGTAEGALWVQDFNSDQIRTDAAKVAGAVAGTEMQVDVLTVIPGVGATNLGKAADAVAGATDTGVPPLAIRDDILTNLTPADGDYVPLRTSNVGSLWVDIHPGSNTFAKKVDDFAGGADKGVAVLAVRDDVLSGLVPVEGDYVHLRVNSTGALHVTGGGGGTEYNEDDVTPNPIVGSAILVERDDALTAVTPIEGDWIGLRGTAEGALWVQDFNSDQIRTDGTKIAGAVSGSEMQVDVVAALPAGTNAIGKLAENSGVDIGDVDVLSVIPGTGATNLGKAVDAVAGGADTGVPPLAIRDDILTTLTPVDGDYVPLRTSNVGSLWVDIHPGSNTFAKKVDDPAGGADKGVAILAVRDDALSGLVPIEGDYVHLRVNSTGALHVTGAGGGTEYNEDDVTPNPIVGTATLIERDDVLTIVTPIQGDFIGLRGTAEGALWTQDFNSDQIRTDTTTIAGAVSGGQMQVDVVAALPAGMNAIGKLVSNSGVDIGDVDILGGVNVTASGALGAAEDTVILASQGRGTVNWEIDAGTLVGTVVFEATLDDTNWFGVNIIRVGGGIVSSTVSFPDRGTFVTTGFSQIRLRVSDFTSGSSNARMEGSLFHSSVVRLGQMLPSGTNNIGDVDVLSLPANASINLNQVGGVAVVTGGVVGSQGVGGLAAGGAVAAGNPVLIAGSDGTNAETILVSASGKQCFMSSSAASDGSSNSIASPVVSATLSFKQAISNFVFNGTTWDRLRGDTSGLHVSAQPARVSTTDTIAAKLATDAIMDGTTALTPKRALIVATTSGDTVVVVGVGGKKIRVLSLAINAFGDANVEFQDAATGTSRSGLFDMGTSAGKAKGLVLAFSPVGHFETLVGVGLDINLSAAVTVEGHLVYVEV